MTTTTDLASHWDRVHTRHGGTSSSWYQPVPHLSLRLVTEAVPAGHVADIGAGTSALAACLLDRGYRVTVVDVSHAALEADRAALGQAVTFVESDVLAWRPDERFDAWHDRAHFHFLTTREDRSRYVDLAATAIRPGGALVMGEFAEDGPTTCSGLPTAGHSADELAGLFDAHFELESARRELHHTPDGSVQPFTWVVLRRR